MKNQKGRKGAGVKGAEVANCRIFRSAVPSSVVVWSILLVSLSGVKKEKVMTIYDAGPLAAGPLCGLLKKLPSSRYWYGDLISQDCPSAPNAVPPMPRPPPPLKNAKIVFIVVSLSLSISDS